MGCKLYCANFVGCFGCFWGVSFVGVGVVGLLVVSFKLLFVFGLCCCGVFGLYFG